MSLAKGIIDDTHVLYLIILVGWKNPTLKQLSKINYLQSILFQSTLVWLLGSTVKNK